MSTDKNKLIPELRFPEFMEDGEWEEKKLGDILVTWKLGGNYQNSESDNGIPVIKMGNLNRGKVNIDKVQYLPINSIYNIDDVLMSGDLLFNTRNTLELVGKVAIWRNELPFAIYNSNLLRMTYDEKYIASNFFMNYIFNTEIGINKLKSIATGTTSVAAIYTKDLRFIKIEIPSRGEQQKIASCLSSLDEVIATHSQKLATLKDHKKGLMQNLFPTNSITNDELEITNVPNYRFPEFLEDGEWVEKKFSSYIKLYRGSSPRPIQEYLTQNMSGVNWIKIGDTKNAVNSIIYKVGEKITFKGAEKSRKVEVGELILANSMSYGKTYELAIEGCIYDGWFVLRKYEEYFYKPFLLQLLNSEYMQKQYKSLSAGGIVQNISSEIVYQTNLFHTSPQEQQKIASCLSSLDDLITAQAEKIAQLKLHKKGLMQGLFPGSITN
jgi:type I restriction enzyme S subunit